jgi:hypothetical protein
MAFGFLGIAGAVFWSDTCGIYLVPGMVFFRVGYAFRFSLT